MNEKNFLARNHCLKEPPEKKENIFSKIRSHIYYKYGIWDAFDLLPYKWNMYYYEHIKPIFNPCNTRIRKSVSRTWKDISHLMVDINFEMIKVFYEDEYKADIVDWEATEHHSEFAKWLESAYNYITKERPQLEKDLENSYPPLPDFDKIFKPTIDENGNKRFEMFDDGIPYEAKYKEVNRIEKLIEDKDTEILTEFTKRRNYFWT